MKRRVRWLSGVSAVLILAFGLLCLNYTKVQGIEHHREVARLHNWPEPGHGIYTGGVAATVLGACSLGFVIGRRPPR